MKHLDVKDIPMATWQRMQLAMQFCQPLVWVT
jgi:hypothetical protein